MPNPTFAYFESTEGGMEMQIVSPIEHLNIRGWDPTSVDDRALCDWARRAEIGDYFEHRMGVCVRLKDGP